MNYNAAHDFRGIISSISAITKLLRSEIKPTENDFQINNLFHTLELSCKEGIHISDELLYSGELESLKNQECKLQDYSLNAIVKEVAQKFRAQMHHKNISFTVQIPDEEIISKIYYSHIKRAITNLLQNAVKFTNISGKITLRLTQNNNVANISVSDNGIGIPAEIHSVIFERFTTARRHGTLDEPPSGLGLSIVKQIIELHNATITFKSSEKIGTTFNIALNCNINNTSTIETFSRLNNMS